MQRRVNAALNGPVTNCLRERNDLAAGRVAFTAPTRRQADGNKQSGLIRRQRTTHRPDRHRARFAAVGRYDPPAASERVEKKRSEARGGGNGWVGTGRSCRSRWPARKTQGYQIKK